MIGSSGRTSVYDTVTGDTQELPALRGRVIRSLVVGPGEDTLYFVQHSLRSDIHLLVAEEAGDR